MIGAIVIGHGQLAQALVEATFSIVGDQEKVVAFSNKACSMKDLQKLIREKSEMMGDVIVFTDLPGGSCTIACKNMGVPIVTGVNLPMLLEFMIIREKHSLEKLAQIMTKKGAEGIRRL